MTTEIATATTTTLAIAENQAEFTEAQIAGLKQLGVDTATRGDLDVFFHTAKRLGLDPFQKQIYMIGRKTKVGGYNGEPERWETKYTIQVGIDGFRVTGYRAARREGLARPVVHRQFCGRDGVWRDVLIEDGPPVAAKTVITCGGEVVGEAVAKFVEYAQTTRNGGLTQMWNEKGTTMIGKCSEAAAWRVAFPQDFSGVYEPAEFHEVIDGEAEPVKVRSERARGVAALREAAERSTAAPANSNESAEPAAEPEADSGRRKWLNRMFALLSDAQCTDRQDQLIVISSLAGQHYGELLEHRDGVTDDQLRRIVTTLHDWKQSGQLDAKVTDLMNAWVAAVSDSTATEK